MPLHTVRLPTPDLEGSLGFYQALGFALSELEATRARLVPQSGAFLELVQAPVPLGAVAVLGGARAQIRDPDGNLLLYAPTPAPPRAAGQATLHGVLCPVGNVNASARWYARVLGWLERFADPHPPWSELAPAPGAPRLALSPPLADEARPAPLLHVPAVRRELERLQEHGLEPRWVRRVPWGFIAGYVDPGGNPLVLMERNGSGSGRAGAP